MRRLTVLAVTAAALLAGAAPAAHGGSRITRLASCPDQEMRYAGPGDAVRFRAAVVCLVSAVRRSQGLNAVKRSPALERAGQGWATTQARTGAVSHGRSVAGIPRRIARAGYRADALNEGLGFGEPGDSPYKVVSSMMGDFACTEILDPRFRDVGAGVSLGKLDFSLAGRGVHVVLEFGLRRGQRPPSGRTRPAKTCPHALPRPLGIAVRPAPQLPAVGADAVTITLTCAGSRPCAFSATLALALRNTQTTLSGLTLAAGQSAPFTFALPAADLAAERAASGGGLDLTVVTTAPTAGRDRYSVDL